MKVDKYKAEQLLAFYETMFKMRRFEEETFEFYKKGMMAGLAHLYLGEEAVATGVCAALKDEDYIASTHRGHGHLVASGADINRMMAEILGKETGYSHGKGGSMHIMAMDKGILGANGIVGGGIPILGTLTGPLRANRFEEVLGILNGTTNYILTMMTKEGLDYDTALKDAQAQGFAEADPTADVEGIDAANKLSILIALMFGKYVAPGDIPTTGITHITKEKIEEARSNGCKIKLIAHAKRLDDGSIEYEVRPMHISESHPLANINKEFNAVFVKGNAVDDLMFYGKGAGPLPTGSAVMGDVIEIAKTISK